jgi:hypothetical protein
MRFAYINSQGKEVAIPSVEALQLRIELGAITSATMFYDASADKWAPAEEHDIFRTLQKEVVEKQEGVYVAPPPPTFESAPARDPFGEMPPPEDEPRAGRFELSDDEEEEPATPATQATQELPHPSDPFGGLGFDLTPLPKEEEPQETASAPAAEGASAFDFGDLSLEVEAPELEPEPPPRPSASLDLETRLGDQDFGSAPPGWATEVELEKPMSEQSDDEDPPWLKQQQASAAALQGMRDRDTDGELESWSAKREPAAKPPAREPTREPTRRPAAAARPAPAAERRSSFPTGVIAALFVVGLLGGLGWFGYSAFRGRATEEEAPPARTYAPVTIPAISAELEPTFRSLSVAALADMILGMTELRLQASLPERPPTEWLSGRYLAGASGFPEVLTYWEGMDALLSSLRSREEDLFRAALEAHMESTALPAADRTVIQERAMAGLQAALPDRDIVYDRLADVITAVTGLHEFLLDNEDNIDYAPAASGTADPVLEAVPISKALGDDMWGRIDRITAALEAMGGRTEEVTTDRLFAITFQQLSATSIR